MTISNFPMKKLKHKEVKQSVIFWTSLVVQCIRIHLPMGYGFDPCSRKIPHVAEQLSPCATVIEAGVLEPILPNKRSHCNKKPHLNQF